MHYEKLLDLSPYIVPEELGSGGPRAHMYRLYGVIVHLDWALSTSSGHYVCYVRVGDRWFKCDDAHISEVDEEAALGQTAYMLFYSRVAWRTAPAVPPLSAAESAAFGM